jgi:hypothetical protein
MQGPVRPASANLPAGVKRLPPPTATISQIVDWALGDAYILVSEDKVAYHVTFQPVPVGVLATRPVPPVPAKGPNGQQNVPEDLGTQVIEGVTAQGRRVTSTTPAGARGNDRPLVSITETWQSLEQGRLMVQKSSNDNDGTQSIRHYTNFSLTVPDPSLFAPPPDYKTVEESGQFTVTVGPPAETVNQPRILTVPVNPSRTGVH